MIALAAIAAVFGYVFVAGVVYEAAPDRWDGSELDRPPREIVAGLWPLLALWAPCKLGGLVFRAPAAARRALAARRAQKALPRAEVISK